MTTHIPTNQEAIEWAARNREEQRLRNGLEPHEIAAKVIAELRAIIAANDAEIAALRSELQAAKDGWARANVYNANMRADDEPSPHPAETMRANVDVEAALDVWFGPSWRVRPEEEVGEPAPMTISLEEHVARAIQERRIRPDFGETVTLADGSKQWIIDHDAELARAAIAAMREREGADKGGAVQRAYNWASGNDEEIPYWATTADPAEAMRAKTIDECEAIARELECANRKRYEESACGGEVSEACANTALAIADAIAALKGKP